MELLAIAVIMGIAFGFVLDRVGATDPDYILGMLRLTRLHLMKTLLLAIGVASILLFLGLMVGVVNPGHLSVKTAYIGVFVGGMILGLGFGLAGYCPGTGLAAAATGRFDGIAFVLGGLTGAAGFMATYAAVERTGLLTAIAGGHTTLGPIAGTKFPALVAGVPGEWLGIAVGIAFCVVAALLPGRLRGTGGEASSAAD